MAVRAVRRSFGFKVEGVEKSKNVLPVELTVAAPGGTYRIYYFENLDLYMKAKTEATEPGV